MRRPPRQQRLQDAGERRLADRDRSGDADHVRHARRDRAEEGRRHALQFLGGADVQVEQPAQRQVDGDDLVDVDPLVDALQRVEILLTERERCRRSQVGPFVAVEREVPIGHVENLRSTRVPPTKAARKLVGAWYTPPVLVDVVVDNVLRGFRPERGRAVRVLDPACGDGRFLFAVAERLAERGIAAELTGCDVDGVALRRDRRAGARDRGRRARPRLARRHVRHRGRQPAVPVADGSRHDPRRCQQTWRWTVRGRSGRVPGARRSTGVCGRRPGGARPAAVDRGGTRRGAGPDRGGPHRHELDVVVVGAAPAALRCRGQRVRARLRAHGTPRSRPGRRPVDARRHRPARHSGARSSPAGTRRNARRTGRDQRQLPRRVLRTRARRARGRRRARRWSRAV